MSDPLEDIRKSLAAVPPPAPDSAARMRAADAAMAAFDAAGAAAGDAAGDKIRDGAQGTATDPRQRDRQSGLTTLGRRWTMSLANRLPSLKSVMLGGASLAVLTLAVLAVRDQSPLPFGSVDGPETPAVTEQETPRAGTGRAEDAALADALRRDREEAAISDRAANRTEADMAAADLADADDGATASAPPAPLAEAEPAPAPAPAGGIVGPLSMDGGTAPAARLAPPQAGQTRRLEKRGLTAAQDGRARQQAAEGRPAAALEDETAPRPGYQDQGRDKFEEIEPNPVKVTTEEPVSTFSVDVDTASYAFIRASLMANTLPPKDAVRIEEMVNYFPYDYAPPESREVPFSTDVQIMATPWESETKLMRIAIKGYQIQAAEKPKSNLVFLLDTSGSMNAPDKLPLLIQSFSMLVETLDADDTVAIVVYAGSAGTVLEPTRADRDGKRKILAALQRLRAGGSTAGGEGIRQAYQLAEANFDETGVNRVILATDGDFNVGIRDPRELQGFVERKRESGVFLSVLGFGRGNYNDQLMQTLAQNGNGTAAYIDTVQEARKTLVEEAASTLFPIAKDVKIQVEFNPARVAEYRLIGFETRALAREDFNNDQVDAGEIGAGHAVTALYEIVPVGSARQIDDLRYGVGDGATGAGQGAASDEYAFVKIRYKQPDADESELITQPVTAANEAEPDDDARFAAAVAAFGQLLRGGKHTGDFTYDDVIALANGAKGADPYGYRAEFVQLVRMAKSAAALEQQRR